MCCYSGLTGLQSALKCSLNHKLAYFSIRKPFVTVCTTSKMELLSVVCVCPRCTSALQLVFLIGSADSHTSTHTYMREQIVRRVCID